MRTQDGVCQEKCVSNLKITKNRLFGCKCQINNLLIQYNKEVLDKEVHPYWQLGEKKHGSYLSTETKLSDNYICISSFYKQNVLILEEEKYFLLQVLIKVMMLLILMLIIIIFPVPKKISRFFWRTLIPMKSKISMLSNSFWHEK